MDLSSLKCPKGAKKRKKRVGRGDGSGHGGTSCRGHKGQNSRSGGGVAPGFEGGQMPLIRRVPKRGFRNPFRKKILIVNLDQLKGFEANSVVDEHTLREKGIISRRGDGVKLLGRGEVKVPLKIKLPHVSEGARQKIEAVGGTVE